MAWDPGSRANLDRLRRTGVVAVRYAAKGCNVELELLSNCIGAGSYSFAPYSANERKLARNANELFAALPVGAARLAGKLKGSRAVRTDYMLAGTQSLPPNARFRGADLQGVDCARATHVVSTIYVGGFAIAAGESREMEARASLFGAGAGGLSGAEVEILGDEGDADACRAAQRDGKESTLCTVPLRIGPLPIDNANGGSGGALRGSRVLLAELGETLAQAYPKLHCRRAASSTARVSGLGAELADLEAAHSKLAAAAQAHPPASPEFEALQAPLERLHARAMSLNEAADTLGECDARSSPLVSAGASRRTEARSILISLEAMKILRGSCGGQVDAQARLRFDTEISDVNTVAMNHLSAATQLAARAATAAPEEVHEVERAADDLREAIRRTHTRVALLANTVLSGCAAP
jgi:hypothetical protein